MVKNQNYSSPQYFESLFKVLSSTRFLNKEGLGGNKPIFIQPYDIKDQNTEDEQIAFLIKRLNNSGIPVLPIDLYKLSLDILNEKSLLEKIVQSESNMKKREFYKALQGPLDVKSTIMNKFEKLITSSPHKLIIVYGVDKIYPFVSMVKVLVNIQGIMRQEPVVFFYPGSYDNYSLTLFGKINEDNEYRAFNLCNYH